MVKERAIDLILDVYFDLSDAARLAWRRAQRRPVRYGAAGLFAAVTLAVAVNAALLQPGPHPAPMFGSRSPAVALADPALAEAAETASGSPRDVTALLAAAAPPPQAAEAAPAEAPPASGLVADIQVKLAEAGLYRGPVDGSRGGATEQAIEAFERSRGLPVTGEPTMDLLVALATGLPPQKPAVETLARVQSALNERGFGPLAVDGLMGRETGGAIRRFEKSAGLPETGTVSDALIRALGLSSGA